MSERHKDIGDDEIRIISSNDARCQRGRKHRMIAVWAAVVAAVLLIVVSAVFFLSAGDEAEEAESQTVAEENISAVSDVKYESFPGPEPDEADLLKRLAELPPRPYAVNRDTVVNGEKLTLLCPVNAVPSLEIGPGAFFDSSVVLALQAADIRRDNGEIVGTFVVGGELRSKGEAKAGFCSIINGEITVGVADATPKLEEALMNNGYFFRQYPLVVGGQIVENKPKGRAVRKALAELDGKIYAVISHDRLTFHDFSQALVELGVRNAIYLVGASSSGLYRDADGMVFTFGTIPSEQLADINYIVWR